MSRYETVCSFYNKSKMDTSLYTQYPYHGVYTCDDVNYNPDKPRFKDLLERIYELMNMKRHSSRLKKQREKQRVQKLRKLKFRTSVCDDFNRDVLRCRCGALLVYADTYNPLEGIKNDRTYRQNCIDEMYQMWIHRRRPPKRSSYPSGTVRSQRS